MWREFWCREGRDADLVVVEGQGAIAHPGYAGVTLGLLYGVMPDAMVLAHTAGRERYAFPAPFRPFPKSLLKRVVDATL
jgi:uncharacterized NAD-dependent epimerase/dehydratase family protein